MVGNQVRISADVERTPPLGVVHLGFQGVHRFHDGGYQLHKDMPLGSELDGTLDAVEEGDAELVLEFPQVGGDGGLAQLQAAGGFGDAVETGYMVKADNFPQFHRGALPQDRI